MKSEVWIPVILASSFLIGSENLQSKKVYSSATAINEVADTAAANFVAMAAMGGMKEVETGKQAEQKADNSRVRAFAAMMVRDHTKSNAELKQVAAASKIPMPKMPANMMHMHKLPGVKGKLFDQEYMTMMVADHQKTIALFERAVGNVQDQGIKAFAEKTLPVLKMHLDSARAIYKAVKPWNQ